MFAPYRNGSIGLWAYERSVEGGPVLGEGENHWFWSGYLDGVEAQFGAQSTPITDGTQAPLFVDFDLSSLWHRAYTFGRIELAAPHLNAVVAPDGTLNLAKLAPKSTPEPAAKPEPTPALRVEIGRAHV